MSYILVLVLTILISLLFYKSIIPVIFDVIGLAWICYTTPFLIDNVGYTQNYYFVARDADLVKQITSKGWVVLSQWGLRFNLDYQQFKTLIFIFCMGLLIWSLYRFVGTNYGLFFGLYMIYPVLVDIVQIRYFLSLSIVIFGLSFLQKGKISSYLIYLALLFIAVLIHNSNIIYIIFLIVPIMEKTSYRKLVIRAIICVDFLLLLLQRWLIPIIRNFSTDKQQAYFVSLSLPNIILFITIMLGIAIFSFTLEQVAQSDVSISKTDERIIAFTSNLNIVILLLIPILGIAYNFFRLERISWLILYILISVLIKYKVNWNIKKVKFNMLGIAIFIAIFGFGVMLLHYESLIIGTYPFFN